MNRHFFKNQTCGACGKTFDATEGICPQCGLKIDDFDAVKKFENHLHLGTIKNLVLFFLGWLGFQIIGTAISLIASTIVTAQHSASTAEELKQILGDFLTSADGIAIVTCGAYFILIAAFVAMLTKDYKQVLRPFKKWQSYVFAIAGFVALFALSTGWSMIQSLIAPNSTANENQSSLVVVSKGYPVLSMIVFGLIGPVCEELTYRAGLFSYVSRLNKVLAYIVTILVFALIHFAWTDIGNPDVLVNELLNLPSYMIGGLVLTVVYDKCGFASSVLTHVLYNSLAILLVIVR